MMIQGVSISEMLNQSVTVLTKPSVQSFEQFERRGGQREALIYVGTAAGIAGVVALLFGLLGGIGAALLSFIAAFIIPIIAFFVFAFVLFFMGKQQGGTGTQDEVFYTCALYTAPILAISGAIGQIPLLNCAFLPVSFALLVYQVYLGYLASRSSMNLDQNKAIISVAVAILAQIVLFTILTSIITAIAVTIGIGTGAIPLDS